jgi:hypothetical protein
LTTEDVVRRISAECAFVDVVRQYGERFRAPRRMQVAEDA